MDDKPLLQDLPTTISDTLIRLLVLESSDDASGSIVYNNRIER